MTNPASGADLAAENARLRVVAVHLENTLNEIDAGDIYRQQCCDGHMCGCQGSTYADEILHYGREALAAMTRHDLATADQREAVLAAERAK